MTTNPADWTDTDTPKALLEAVGVEWREKYGVRICPECGCRVGHYYNCRRPSTRDDPYTYTGPALGTPELDAILLVAGFKWMCKNGRHEAHVHLHDELPGHALARAIKEIAT